MGENSKSPEYDKISLLTGLAVGFGGGDGPGLAPYSGVRAFDLGFLPALPQSNDPQVAQDLGSSRPTQQGLSDENQ